LLFIYCVAHIAIQQKEKDKENHKFLGVNVHLHKERDRRDKNIRMKRDMIDKKREKKGRILKKCLKIITTSKESKESGRGYFS